MSRIEVRSIEPRVVRGIDVGTKTHLYVRTVYNPPDERQVGLKPVIAIRERQKTDSSRHGKQFVSGIGGPEAYRIRGNSMENGWQRRFGGEQLAGTRETPLVPRLPCARESCAATRELSRVVPADRLEGKVRPLGLCAGSVANAVDGPFRRLRRG